MNLVWISYKISYSLFLLGHNDDCFAISLLQCENDNRERMKRLERNKNRTREEETGSAKG